MPQKSVCVLSKIGRVQLQVLQYQRLGLYVHIGETDHAREHCWPGVGVKMCRCGLAMANAAAIGICLVSIAPERIAIRKKTALFRPQGNVCLLPGEAC